MPDKCSPLLINGTPKVYAFMCEKKREGRRNSVAKRKSPATQNHGKNGSNTLAGAVIIGVVPDKVILESRIITATNKPLNENIVCGIQVKGIETRFVFSHSNIVIGLQCKYTAKKDNSKYQKVERIVQFLSK